MIYLSFIFPCTLNTVCSVLVLGIMWPLVEMFCFVLFCFVLFCDTLVLLLYIKGWLAGSLETHKTICGTDEMLFQLLWCHGCPGSPMLRNGRFLNEVCVTACVNDDLAGLLVSKMVDVVMESLYSYVHQVLLLLNLSGFQDVLHLFCPVQMPFSHTFNEVKRNLWICPVIWNCSEIQHVLSTQILHQKQKTEDWKVWLVLFCFVLFTLSAYVRFVCMKMLLLLSLFLHTVHYKKLSMI